MNDPRQIKPVTSTLSSSNLILWLREALADVLGRPASEVSTKDRLRDQGLDSKGATDLVSRLSKHIGRPLEVILAWQYPTVERLAAHVLAQGPPRSREYVWSNQEELWQMGQAF